MLIDNGRLVTFCCNPMQSLWHSNELRLEECRGSLKGQKKLVLRGFNSYRLLTCPFCGQKIILEQGRPEPLPEVETTIWMNREIICFQKRSTLDEAYKLIKETQENGPVWGMEMKWIKGKK